MIEVCINENRHGEFEIISRRHCGHGQDALYGVKPSFEEALDWLHEEGMCLDLKFPIHTSYNDLKENQMPKTILREDKNLAEIANNIFGGLVVNAWVASWDVTGFPRSPEEIKEEFDQAYTYSNPDKIDNYTEIVLEFISKAKVYFSISEWGEITRINDIENDFVEYKPCF